MIGLSCCVSLFVGHDASDRFHSSCTNYCLIAHHPRAVIQDVAFVSTSECSVRGGGVLTYVRERHSFSMVSLLTGSLVYARLRPSETSVGSRP